MGIDGIENLTDSDQPTNTERVTDQARRDQRESERDAAREAHNARVKGTRAYDEAQQNEE